MPTENETEMPGVDGPEAPKMVMDEDRMAVAAEPVAAEPDAGAVAELVAEAAVAPAVAAVDWGDDFCFDAAFYMSFYPDVAQYAEGARDHYLRFGRAVGRLGSEQEVAWAVAAIAASGRFDFAYYESRFGQKDDPIRDLVLFHQGRDNPAPYFDEKFFRDYYPNLVGPTQNAFLAYCMHQHQSWCMPSAASFEEYANEIREHALFSWGHMLAQVPPALRTLNMAIYYCTEGFRLQLDPSEQFSTRGYFLESPDIAEAQLNPLVHYIRYGHTEGRAAPSRAAVQRDAGLRRDDPEKPTILVVSHEASRSGAPIVGLNLARALSSRYNVISVLLRRGDLFAEFKRFSTEVVVAGDRPGAMWCAVDAIAARRRIDAAVLNSVECSKLLPALVEHDIPAVTLIHEFAQYCWPFTLHARAITLSDAVVYPAEVVRDAAFLEMVGLGLEPANVRNASICAQGRPIVPPATAFKRFEGVPTWLHRRIDRAERPFVVMGAGWVQPRKGVDLFVEAARIARHVLKLDCVFVWVGPNYEPEKDMLVSLYLADQVEQSGLSDTVFFIDEQSSLKPFWAIADLFFVSSRLDPFPNVAIDAIAEGIPLVCFERATGIAELQRSMPDRVTAVPYNSAADVARVAVELAAKTPPGQRPARIPASAELDAFVSFQRYADALSERIEAAIAGVPGRRALADALQASLTFEPQMLARSMPAWMKSPGLGAAVTVDGLARVAAAAARNGVDIGAVWPGAVAAADDAAGMRRVFRIVGRPRTRVPPVHYAAIVVVNDPALLSSVVTHVLTIGAVRAITLVGSDLPEADVELLRAVAGNAAVTCLDCSGPGGVGGAHARLMATHSGGVHVVATPFPTMSAGAAQQPFQLFEVSAGNALHALAAAPDGAPLDVIVQQPDWVAEQGRRLPKVRRATTPVLLPPHLVDVNQCYARVSQGGWAGPWLLDVLQAQASGRPWTLWDTVRPHLEAIPAAQRGIVAEQWGLAPSTGKLLYGSV